MSAGSVGDPLVGVCGLYSLLQTWRLSGVGGGIEMTEPMMGEGGSL